ncbi:MULTISPECIES: beta-ketoacyl-ACP synthase [unclassified Janthinobacterium]|uniref:beta-ketoacyl-ACP synthase n=1 Tax=unclassified Janthinobacterium TaxID=2610881 RepID=UPI00160A26BC|nr:MULTISPECIES: beta-ketoacyl-ACP synthase [unclassified Janthinobacterium]MBB5607749.1 3-oxoacyl-[acyl-carrier-protein] synthase-1 [Janthinobacterium sp. S3T4]MBB5613102.1 3-oxoacyl-[acyl-carrier-protein] synthase-1 [Janthinobacterium sp. S3M3]
MAGLTVYLNACGIICALGSGAQEVRARLFAAHSGVVPVDSHTPGRRLPLGVVDTPLPSIGHHAIGARSRNNQMALAALAQIRPAVEQAITRYGASRVAVVIGTSTSGIAETEAAIGAHVAGHGLPGTFHYAQQEMGSPALMLAQELGIDGPAWVHSTACSSAAKAMASAARLIRMGLVDAVLTGGVDTLCGFTVAGFSALASVSAQRCNPLGAGRDGINIGEGAALFLMTAEPSAVALQGWGESSDGHHMSAPDPEGGGARLAISSALARAGIRASQVDYVNLHGTATRQNDAMEARVIADLFGGQVMVSSTKPLTGHALGAAAAIEAALCWLAMQDDNPEGMLPPHLWNGLPDESLPPLSLALPGARLGRPLDWALSNSFAFGGSNAVLLFGRGA